MVQPFLKWAGGKRWMAHNGSVPIPENYNSYIEPFLGSAAVFFHLNPDHAIISDVNPDLINLYSVMKSSPSELWELMRAHHFSHNKDYYYYVRELSFSDQIEKAAQFLYLNRTCFNGLYRVNLNGKFNVPIGTKDTVIFEGEDFSQISKRLQNAEIQCCDFEKVVDRADCNDYLFVDPPYTVKHNLNGFIKYNEKLFSWEDQERLYKALCRAADRGAYIVVTNADHDCVRQLYSQNAEYLSLPRHSKIAGKSSKRTKTTEALFTFNFTNEVLSKVYSEDVFQEQAN